MYSFLQRATAPVYASCNSQGFHKWAQKTFLNDVKGHLQGVQSDLGPETLSDNV